MNISQIDRFVILLPSLVVVVFLKRQENQQMVELPEGASRGSGRWGQGERGEAASSREGGHTDL